MRIGALIIAVLVTLLPLASAAQRGIGDLGVIVERAAGSCSS